MIFPRFSQKEGLSKFTSFLSTKNSISIKLASAQRCKVTSSGSGSNNNGRGINGYNSPQSTNSLIETTLKQGFSMNKKIEGRKKARGSSKLFRGYKMDIDAWLFSFNNRHRKKQKLYYMMKDLVEPQKKFVSSDLKSNQGLEPSADKKAKERKNERKSKNRRIDIKQATKFGDDEYLKSIHLDNFAHEIMGSSESKLFYLC